MYEKVNVPEPTREGRWWKHSITGYGVVIVERCDGMRWRCGYTWRLCRKEGITWTGPIPVPDAEKSPPDKKMEKLLCEQADLLTTQAGLLAAHETRLGELEDAVGHIQAGPHGEEK